jgi:hypothetical protein
MGKFFSKTTKPEIEFPATLKDQYDKNAIQILSFTRYEQGYEMETLVTNGTETSSCAVTASRIAPLTDLLLGFRYPRTSPITVFFKDQKVKDGVHLKELLGHYNEQRFP